MSQFERNITYFNINKIIYRRDPVTDKPTQSFDWGSFYEDGTHECYTLFQSKAKITTYKSLKWHLYVLWYLNPQIDQDMFQDLAYYICYKESGFVTFRVSDQLLQSMIYDVSLMDLDKPPPNKLRKVIFKDYSGLSMNEKLSLVGKLIGRKKLSENDIYEAMLIVHDNKDKISVSKLSIMLNCSTRTIYRNMNNELKREKELLNKQLKQL